MAEAKNYNTPAKLKALLEEMLDVHRLPINRKGVISRKNVAEEAGFPSACMFDSYLEKARTYEWAANVVNDFEARLLMKEGGHISGVNLEHATPARLKKLLKKLRKSLDIPLAPNGASSGRISFRSFGEKFGFPDYVLYNNSKEWTWARDMLSELDEELYEKCLIGTVWERKVPEIRNHLEKLRKKGELPVNEYGKLSRMAVMCDGFGMPRNQSTNIAEARAPKLKQLFAEYDDIIKKDGYSQYSGDAYVEELKDLLESDELVLDKDRQRVGRRWLSKELGLSKGKIKQSRALMELIEQKEAEIAAGLRRGTTKKSFKIYGAASINLGATPFSEKHKRVFAFDDLIPLYGLEFAEKVGTVFIAVTSKLESVKGCHARIRHFLSWIADENNGAGDVFDALVNDEAINDKRFSRVCLEYQQALYADPDCPKHQYFAVITRFGEARVFPKHTFRKKARRYTKDSKDSGHRKSILEADRKSISKRVTKILEDAARYRNIELEDGKDTKAFVATLVDENELRDDLSADIAEAMLEITLARLLDMRKQASKVFNEWKQMHEQGSSLIESATIDVEATARFMDEYTGSKNASVWKIFVRDVFPGDRPNETLCNLLALIDYRYDGLPPNPEVGGQFWNKQYRKVGGINEVLSRLMPTRRAVSSAITLYLCESGVNSEVALALAPDCIHDSDVPAHKKIVGTKRRSHGKAIYDDLPVKSSSDEIVPAISAIEYIVSSNSRITNKQKSAERYAATYVEAGKVKALAEYSLRSDFKEICNKSGYLSNYNFTPSMLRPTVLLEIQLKDPTNLGTAQLIAQHESQTTTVGYTNKLPHRITQEEHILGYQRSLEFVVSQKVENPHLKLGVSEAEWNDRIKHAQRTGLGVFCEDRSVVDKDGKEEKCVNVESCVQCKHDRMLVSADIHSIAEMIVWKKSLEIHESQWLSERLDRWTDVWVPWQAFFHVVIEEKMARGRLSKIKKDAIALVESIMKQDGFAMPEPW